MELNEDQRKKIVEVVSQILADEGLGETYEDDFVTDSYEEDIYSSIEDFVDHIQYMEDNNLAELI